MRPNVFLSPRASETLQQMMEEAEQTLGHREKRFLLGLELDEFGRDESLYDLLRDDRDRFQGHYGGLLIHSREERFTKEMAGEALHILSLHGAGFPGHPLVEWIPEGKNLRKWAAHWDMSREEARTHLCRGLGARLRDFVPEPSEKLLILHANSRPERSNTMDFFEAMKGELQDISWEVTIASEEVKDCAGCSFSTCGYFSERDSCYHGGFMTDILLQKIESAGAVLFLAPNYNDALSAKIMAIINRLSVLYRKGPFYDKWLFAVIVSGNSGSDSVARQLIGALTLNKGFRLPPHFYAHAIANDPGEILKDEKMHEKARHFAGQIRKYMVSY